MASIRRRKVTLVITETWTIIWLTENDPLHTVTSVIQSQRQIQAQQEEVFQATAFTG